MTTGSRRAGVVVVGSSNTDMVLRVPVLPCPGETVLGTHFSRVAGGKGANQAVAAARAGANVCFIGCVGDDDLGREALAGLVREGIGVDRVHVESGQPSGVALICVEESGENSISVAPGANACLLPAHIDSTRDAFEGAHICLIQLEIPLETVVHAAELAHGFGAHVILNPAPAQTLPAGLLDSISTIVPNEPETHCLTGVSPATTDLAEKAAAVLRSTGVSNVVLTLGERGALVASSNGVALVPSCRVEVVDTTAAGDAFCGALAAALGEGRPMVEAAAFACQAASLTVSLPGAQPSIPSRAQIDAAHLTSIME